MKNRVNRILTAALITTLTAGALAGCGNTAPAAGSDTAESAAEQTTEDAQAAEDTGAVRTIYAVTGATPRPFTYYGDDNALTGQNIDLINAVFEKLPQYELVWEVTDFPSIFAGLDSDKYQLGVNNFAKNAEREEKYYFTDPIFANAYIVVANKDIDLPEQIDVSDLAGYSFIGEAGINVTTIVENYNESGEGDPIEINYTEEDLNVQLQDIDAGKYDFTIIDKPMYFGFYQPEFGYDLGTHELTGYGVGDGMESYLIVSKTEENKQLVEDINKALREVIEEGTSKELNIKYFGDDYSPSYED